MKGVAYLSAVINHFVQEGDESERVRKLVVFKLVN